MTDAVLVEQFVDATGGTMAEALRYLKLCDNDVNNAVGSYFDPETVRNYFLINCYRINLMSPFYGELFVLNK